MIHVCGDVHGLWSDYDAKRKKYPLTDTIFVLGDVGVGFKNWKTRDFGENVYLIRGNHDNPEKFKLIHNALPNFGTIEIEGMKIGWVSGGYSIDKQYRTQGIDWWQEEEMSYHEMLSCVEFMESENPEIMLSHECPNRVSREMYRGGKIFTSRTSDFLDELASLSSIKKWYFGHHHKSVELNIVGVEYHAINELEFKAIA